MRRLDDLGSRIERGLDQVEARTASGSRQLLLGVALAFGTTVGGLAGFFILLKLLTGPF